MHRLCGVITVFLIISVALFSAPIRSRCQPSAVDSGRENLHLLAAVNGILGFGCQPQRIDSQLPLASEPSDWRPLPTGAALRSLVIPGWGQAYNRQPLKSVVIAGLESGFIYGILRQHKLQQACRARGDLILANLYREDRNRFAWYLAGSVILAMLDAYVDAQLFNFDVSDEAPSRKSTPNPQNSNLFHWNR